MFRCNVRLICVLFCHGKLSTHCQRLRKIIKQHVLSGAFFCESPWRVTATKPLRLRRSLERGDPGSSRRVEREPARIDQKKAGEIGVGIPEARATEQGNLLSSEGSRSPGGGPVLAETVEMSPQSD